MSWVATAKLGDLVEILSGFPFDSEKFGDSGDIRIARIRDVVPGRSSTFYRGGFDPQFVINDEDLLIGMDGEFNRARWQGGRALLNQRVCRIRAANGDLHEPYLFHFLPRALKSIEDATPFVTVKHLSTKSIRAIDIPLPPLGAQQRIAAILDKADALRAKRRAALAQLDTLTQSIFLDMFGDPAQNANKLPTVPLGELGDWQSGGTPPRNQDRYFIGEIPWFSSGELEDMHLFKSKEHVSREALHETSAKAVPMGSLMLGMYDTAALKASIAGVDCSCNQAIAFAKINDRKTDVVFLYFAIAIGRDYFRRLQRGVRQKNLNLSMIREMRLPLPARDAQRSFARRIAIVERSKVAQRASLGEIDHLFSSLQHRAFKGEL